jgi:hypothetical protein
MNFVVISVLSPGIGVHHPLATGLGPPHPQMPPANQELVPALCAKQFSLGLD